MTCPKVDPRRERWAKPEVIADAIEGTVHDNRRGIRPKQLASELHVSEGDVYDFGNPSRQRPLKVAQLVPLMKLTDDYRILRFLAECCGFLLVEKPPAEVSNGEAFQLSREVIRETAEAIEAFALALEDGPVTPEEAGSVAQQCDEGVAALSRLKATAEAQALLGDVSRACAAAAGRGPMTQ